MKEYSLIVVGGGPAGLFCALQAAVPGRSVLVLEKKSSCGKKLLITGSGQCNLTHEGDIRSFVSHYGDNGFFLKPSLMNCKNSDLITFFSDRGLELSTEPGGKIFPKSRKANDILSILLDECVNRGVVFRCEEPVITISKTEDSFQVSTTYNHCSAERVVIATGGLTYPVTGSTGDGFRFAQNLGHQVTDVRPALSPVVVRDYRWKDLSGISLPDVPISLFRNGKKMRQHTGDILFTHSGLSGPGILDFSRYIQPDDILKLSFITGSNSEAMKERLVSLVTSSGSRLVRTALSDLHLPDRLVRKILEITGIDQSLTAAHLTKQDRMKLGDLLVNCPFTVERMGGPEEAMVTSGGVSLSMINPKTMESKLVPGLYFIGEVLDIDGDTGGYNLQAAFSTAALAASHIRKKWD